MKAAAAGLSACLMLVAPAWAGCVETMGQDTPAVDPTAHQVALAPPVLSVPELGTVAGCPVGHYDGLVAAREARARRVGVPLNTPQGNPLPPQGAALPPQGTAQPQ